MNSIKKLGVFDSGVGGLTVLQDLAQLKCPEIIYCADTLNLPYGQKTKSHIEQLTLNAVSFLVNAGVDAVVLACHTASANAYDFVHAQFQHLLLFDVVGPSVQQALQATCNNRIGIIGTQATITSAIHQSKIIYQQPDALVFNQACPLFVPLIEAGLKDKKALHDAIELYLNPLLKQDIDTLIIGCTHYEIIVDYICDLIGSGIFIVSVPPLMQQKLMPFIKNATTQPTIKYIVSGDVMQFQTNALRLLNCQISDDCVKNVHLPAIKPINQMLRF